MTIKVVPKKPKKRKEPHKAAPYKPKKPKKKQPKVEKLPYYGKSMRKKPSPRSI